MRLFKIFLFCISVACTTVNAGIDTVQAIPTDQKELETLIKPYKAGFTIKGVPGLKKVYLTFETVQHVFGAEVKPKNDPLNTMYISGYHHSDFEHHKKFFYSSWHTTANRIGEGWVAFDKKDLPVYKTFFPLNMSKQEIITLLIQSLKNLKNIEDQKDKWALLGETVDGIRIKTIVNKETGNIITFYPITDTPKQEIAAKTKNIQVKFVKFFQNYENKPTRKPISQEEITELLKPFSKGINFNMTPSKVDKITPAMQKEHLQIGFLKKMPPYWASVLIPKSKVSSLMKKYPERIIPGKNIKNLYLTPEVLEKVFSEKDASFPLSLTRSEILSFLKEAVKNIFSEVGEESVQINNNKTERELVFPRYHSEKNNTISLRGRTKSREEGKNFTFYIVINQETGVIEDFHILFY